jgi:hypothetical protein
MTSVKEKWAGWVPFAFLLFAWVGFHNRVLFQNQTFVLEDSSRFFYPLWKWGAGVWNNGRIPLWNPDAAFGTPYLADPQMAAWYLPARVLYFLLSPTSAFTFLILFHHLWALVGFWIYARGRGYSPWIALGGAFIFGFSFNAITLSWATPMLFAYSWVPWIFHHVDSLRKYQNNAFLFLSISIAMQMAAGYPLFSYLTLLVMALEWVLVHSTSGWGKNCVKETGLELGAVLTAFAFNAVWLLPFKEFIPYSNLSQRLDLSESLSWSDLPTWLNPFFEGHPLHSHPETPFSVTVYFAGLPALVMGSWLFWKQKFNKAPTILFFILLILSLGSTTLVGGWLKSIFPGYGMIVRSGYWIPFVVWALACVFLEGGENFARMEGKNGIWGSLVILFYAFALILGVPWELGSFWISFLFLICAGLSKHFSLDWRGLFLTLSVAFSLGPVAQSIAFTMKSSYYDHPPAVFSRLSSLGRIYNAPSVEDHFRNVSGNGAADIYLKIKEAVVSNWPLAFGFQETGYSNALFMKPYLNWYFAPYWSPGSVKILNYLNGRYVVGWMPCFSGLDFMRAGTVPLWDNSSAELKWRSCLNAIPENDWKTDLDIMKKEGFNFSKTCFVSDHLLDGAYQPRIVSVIQDEPNQEELKVSGHGKALLVSSEMDYPGWKITGNGARGRVEEVNHGFRGVTLEEGQEIATLSYQPTTFRLGAFLFLLTCAFWAGMILKLIVRYYA